LAKWDPASRSQSKPEAIRCCHYIARRHQDGLPLEQTGYGRRAISSDRLGYMRDTGFVRGARRFDKGERNHFISLEMTSIGMEMSYWPTPAAAVVADPP
jgi:hypothetical protein